MGETIHITTEYLTNEGKVILASCKVDVLEVESSKPWKELITAMDSGNQLKEQVKVLIGDLRAEKLLTKPTDEQLQATNRAVTLARDNVVHAFQLTNEYNNIWLSWYFKCFELLKRYLTKNNPRVDLEGLDFETVDKEKEAEEANAVEGAAPEAAGDEGAIIRGDDLVA